MKARRTVVGASACSGVDCASSAPDAFLDQADRQVHPRHRTLRIPTGRRLSIECNEAEPPSGTASAKAERSLERVR